MFSPGKGGEGREEGFRVVMMRAIAEVFEGAVVAEVFGGRRLCEGLFCWLTC